ncbi:hypothetical protein [Micromonospora sp. NPDC005189]|uniref:hypothetical protein n=1 Tax=unclassified Micromonospora TaxID=2617518 RepID=UPI0033B8DB03
MLVPASLDPPSVQPPVRLVAGTQEPDVRLAPQLVPTRRPPFGVLLPSSGELVSQLPTGAERTDEPGQGGSGQRGQCGDQRDGDGVLQPPIMAGGCPVSLR